MNNMYRFQDDLEIMNESTSGEEGRDALFRIELTFNDLLKVLTIWDIGRHEEYITRLIQEIKSVLQYIGENGLDKPDDPHEW